MASRKAVLLAQIPAHTRQISAGLDSDFAGFGRFVLVVLNLNIACRSSNSRTVIFWSPPSVIVTSTGTTIMKKMMKMTKNTGSRRLSRGIDGQMRSLAPTYLAGLRVPQQLVARVRQLGQHKGRQELFRKQAPEMLENLRRVAIIESTESSNRLEGIVADEGRVRQIVERKVEPANRSEAEIAGYRDVLNTIHQNYARVPFTDRIVLQLHRDLSKYAGGRGGLWKITANEISEKLPDGTKRTRFVPLAPHLTEDAMRELHSRFNELLKEGVWEPLFLIAFYVLDFLCIHPFLDGNGRMSRLLSVLSLYHQGYDVSRYISVERIIEQSKDSYYDTLLASSQGWHEGKHDVWPWTEYFLGTLLAAYSDFESKFGRISKGRGSKTDTIRNAIDGFIADFSITDLERACPMVSRDMIRHVLGDLRKSKIIVPIGRGRGAKWRKAGK
jgi:Fic family protein